MKKLFLAGALALLGAVSVNAQTGSFKLGAHIGLPVGDTADNMSFNLGADAAYVWNVAPNFELGVTTGYSHYLAKDYTYTDPFTGRSVTVKADGSGIVPLAATGKYNITPEFFLGTDLGYAFFTGKGADGGAFYYQPKVGYNFSNTELYLGYKGMSKDGASVSSVNLGFNYYFK